MSKPMFEPRNAAAYWRADHCPDAPTVLLTRAAFDALVPDGFADGPFLETFGDGYGEPYRPYRQAWGLLLDGRFAFCELHQDRRTVGDE